MSSNVTCRANAVWAVNTIGQDACQQYATLLGICDPNFHLSALSPTSTPYLPPSSNTAACACNLIAYNLASACRWCQDTLQPLWWATQAEWTARCTSLGQPFVGLALPSTFAAANLTISDWALNVTITDGTWDPTLVSRIVAAHNPSNTDPAMVSGGPSSITSSGQFPSGITEGRPPTPGISEPPESSPSWEKPRANDVIGIAIGVVLLALSLGFLTGFILCRRRRARKTKDVSAHCHYGCHHGDGDRPQNDGYAESVSTLPTPLKYNASPRSSGVFHPSKLSNEAALA